MKTDRLQLPKGYIIDNDCIELMKDHLCDYMIQEGRVKEYLKKGINIVVTIPFKVIYKNHYYWCSVVKDDDNCFWWYMRGYWNITYKTSADDEDSFEKVINAIISKSSF